MGLYCAKLIRSDLPDSRHAAGAAEAQVVPAPEPRPQPRNNNSESENAFDRGYLTGFESARYILGDLREPREPEGAGAAPAPEKEPQPEGKWLRIVQDD